MCGRYASSRSPESLLEVFEIEENEMGDGGQPRYNVAPTQTAPVVVERLRAEEAQETEEIEEAGEAGEPVEPADPTPGAASEGAERAVRQLRGLTWGLVPSWSKERTGGARMINARAETLLEKPAYKRPALARRCLVPADGWYEWQVSPTATDAKGKPRKQPFYMSPADGGPIAFAGIYEFWRDKAVHADDPEAWLVTFAIVTTAAEPGLDVVHDRMPFALPADRWEAWLDPRRRDPDDVRALLEPPPPGRFTALPVTTRVNSVRNEGPELIEPAPADQVIGVVDPATGEIIGAAGEALF